ncbi:MAG: HAD family phosphatase [Lachnospiraceae bacterium]|nr:HAD family phosphatase [Lachnospiraceae bacterium]
MGKKVIKAVIFDMDGLMIDTEKLLQRFWCEAANEFGYPMKPEHSLKIRSLSAKLAEPMLKQLVSEDFDYQKVRKRRIELMNEYIREHGVEEKEGLKELLSYLKKEKYEMAVATATDYERTKLYLSSIGVFSYFSQVVCGNMVKNGKPEPDIYQLAAQKLGYAPEECMALEDSPNGILAAYRAGVLPVMVPDLDSPGEETKKIAYQVVENLREVIPVLKK